MNDTSLVVAERALDLGLDVDLDQCIAIAKKIDGRAIDRISVREAAESLGIPIPAAA